MRIYSNLQCTREMPNELLLIATISIITKINQTLLFLYIFFLTLSRIARACFLSAELAKTFFNSSNIVQ